MISFEQAKKEFEQYVSTFRDADDSVPYAISAKRSHTHEVCRITEELVHIEGCFSSHESLLFSLCALYHDLSRFEQFQRFHTFLDAISFDHGNRSAELIGELHFLTDFPAEDRLCVIDAVRIHNKIAIPPDFPTPHLAAAKMVRDADKLAILHLIIRFFQSRNDDPSIRLDLPDTNGWTPAIYKTVADGHSVCYTDMRNVNDFKLAVFAWSSDLNYPASGAYAIRESLFEHLRDLLPESPDIDLLLALAQKRLQKLRDGVSPVPGDL